MKQSIYIVILILIVSCESSRVLLENEVNISFEYGKGYCSFNKNDSNNSEKGGFIMEVVPAKFEVETINYPIEYFEKYTSNVFRLQKSEEYGRFVLKKNPKNFVPSLGFDSYSCKESYIFYWVKVPSQFKTFSTDDLTKDGLTISKTKIKTKAHLIKKYVKKPPKKLRVNQYYFEGGDWSEIIEYNPPTRCFNIPIIRLVKAILKNSGYDLEIDDEYDEKTKKALKDFQLKNGLKTDSLNVETLNFMGL